MKQNWKSLSEESYCLIDLYNCASWLMKQNWKSLSEESYCLIDLYNCASWLGVQCQVSDFAAQVLILVLTHSILW